MRTADQLYLLQGFYPHLMRTRARRPDGSENRLSRSAAYSGRNLRPGRACDERILQKPGSNQASHRRRGLAAHRRHRYDERGQHAVYQRKEQKHDTQCERTKHISGRDRKQTQQHELRAGIAGRRTGREARGIGLSRLRTGRRGGHLVQ